jgi:hypothetical protein
MPWFLLLAMLSLHNKSYGNITKITKSGVITQVRSLAIKMQQNQENVLCVCDIEHKDPFLFAFYVLHTPYFLQA